MNFFKYSMEVALNHIDEIIHAVKNNNSVIPVNDDTDVLLKDLKKADLGYYDKDGFRLYSHVVGWIEHHEKIENHEKKA